MEIRSIALHIDRSKAMSKRIDAAVSLARRFSARLDAVYIPPPLDVAYLGESVVAAQALASEFEALRADAAKAHKYFEDAVHAAGVSCTYHELDGDAPARLAEAARYSDLLMVGQDDPDDSRSTSRTTIESAMLMAGRPSLVIPYIGTADDFGSRVLIAWNASREAARAVHDAMPLIRTATKVDVIGVGAADDRELVLSRLNRFEQYLKAHDITCSLHDEIDVEGDIGELMLSRISDMGSNLLVMGAYGHSPMRELLLGGVSRTLLREMTVPVLMSH
ncbi:MAG: universal stress protein [Gammaproteobacteria bacterium]|nr:universal stress protein [Gammaproteobacteria bacterium]